MRNPSRSFFLRSSVKRMGLEATYEESKHFPEFLGKIQYASFGSYL